MKKMLLKCPYLTIIFILAFLSSVSICIFCVAKITNIYSLFGYDILKRNYMWLRDLKIGLICFYAYTILLMGYNLIISFRSTGNVTLKKKDSVFCLDSSLVQKFLLCVNQITLAVTFTLTMLVSTVAFVFWVLTRLCIDGSNVPKSMPLDPYKMNFNPGELGQSLDLRSFTPLLGLRPNETMFLYFENDRLKTFCDDYVSILYLYNLIFFVSTIIFVYSIFNLTMIYSYNLSKNLTRKKLQELYFLNMNEMTALNAN